MITICREELKQIIESVVTDKNYPFRHSMTDIIMSKIDEHITKSFDDNSGWQVGGWR